MIEFVEHRIYIKWFYMLTLILVYVLLACAYEIFVLLLVKVNNNKNNKVNKKIIDLSLLFVMVSMKTESMKINYKIIYSVRNKQQQQQQPNIRQTNLRYASVQLGVEAVNHRQKSFKNTSITISADRYIYITYKSKTFTYV